MPLLTPKCLCPGAEVSNSNEDFCNATRVAQYRVSGRAFYLPAFPGWQYIPLSSLTGVVARNASLPTTGCCGKELPVLKLILRYDGGDRELVIDPPRHIDTILDRIHFARPDLAVDDRR